MITLYQAKLNIKLLMNNILLPYGNIKAADELGSIIRLKRRADGITQQQLAGVIGVGTRVISDIENGKSTAEIGKVLAVLQGLGLSTQIMARGWD